MLAQFAPDVNSGITPLRVTEIQPSAAQVEVTNISQTTYTATQNLPFAHRADTASFIPNATVFAPGESKTFSLPGLDAADSDIWLYNSASFSSPAAIESGVKYGPASNVGNTAVAVSAGIWPSTSAFVATPANAAESLKLVAYRFGVVASWANGAPNFGSFFGTGTAVANPIVPLIQKGATRIELQPILTGMSSPLGTAYPDDGSDRLFVYDQTGTVTLVLNGVPQPTHFMDVSARLKPLRVAYDECGLLGFACHPNFAANPKVYTYTTEPPQSGVATFTTAMPPAGFDHDNVIAEWTLDAGNPNIVNVASRRELIRINHPAFNHNGGTIRFGPDGLLYISIGDGGAGDDQGIGHLPDGNAQAIENIYGKVLRINPDGSNSANGQYGIPADNPFVAQAGLDEIFAYGFRNPYAFSFDKQTGQLYLGDAGQNKIEEVDIVTNGGNYGWRLKEGSFLFDPNGSAAGFITTLPVKPLPVVDINPFAEYDHDEGVVVVGGFVYRGTAVPALQGLYITGDFARNFGSPSGRLFFANGSGQLSEFIIGNDDRALGLFLKGFGEDRNGEVYVCGSTALAPRSTSGVVYKVVSVPSNVSDWSSYD